MYGYYYGDDPANDYERFMDSLPKSPRCDCCGEMVGDEFWKINGDIYCCDCLQDCKHYTDDYMASLMEV